MHDSATATVRSGGPLSSAATWSSIVEPSSENSCAPCRPRMSSDEGRVGVLRARLVERRDLDLAAPQARRDLQRREVESGLLGDEERLGDLGLGDPHQPQDRLLVDRSRPRSRHETRPSRAPPPTSAAARAAGRAARRPSGPPSSAAGGTTTPGAVPTGSSTVAPCGHVRLLARAARHRGAVDVRPALRERRDDRRDPLLQLRVEHQRPAREVGDHLGREVVRRRAEPAARDDQVHALGARGSAARRPCPRGGRRRSRCARRSTPSSRRRSDSHGPLRSEMIPLRTSVPVTTMPARALTCSVGACVGRQRAGADRGDLVGDRRRGRGDCERLPVHTQSAPRCCRA